jgi:hypothetical protein
LLARVRNMSEEKRPCLVVVDVQHLDVHLHVGVEVAA